MFDSKNTLCLVDLRELDELVGSAMQLRSRLLRFVTSNPQLADSDVSRLASVDGFLDSAVSRLSCVASEVRGSVYGAGFSRSPREDFEFYR